MGLLNGKASYVILGAAAVLSAKWLGPVFTPLLTGVVKPAVKTTLKLGWISVEYARELGSELVEVLEDAIAEARHELVQDARRTNAEDKAHGTG